MSARRVCCACSVPTEDEEGSYCANCIGALTTGAKDWQVKYKLMEQSAMIQLSRELRIQAHAARVHAELQRRNGNG